jgi:Phenazine biosynthesis-like protein
VAHEEEAHGGSIGAGHAGRAKCSASLNDVTSYRYVVADVFTDEPLTGNQLAVFTDATGLPEALMQPLAREIGFS